ncbi:MAG: glycosyltransferase [Bacteroidetes bacterium]|nr:MAG: glycosyltransferase [Bacteroidota bacterium]
MSHKVVHISSSDRGGAGIAAYHLHQELRKHGVNSSFLTLYRYGKPEKNTYLYSDVDHLKIPGLSILYRFFQKVRKRLFPKKEAFQLDQEKYLKGRPSGYEHFSFPLSAKKLRNHPLVKKADIIHLHWVSDGFLDPREFFPNLDKKVYWTLHDMNPFTGGCHHADDCQGYEKECRDCPQLTGTVEPNMAHEMWQRKKNAFESHSGGIKIISPSRWLLEKAQQSALFRSFEGIVIPNPVDLTNFKLLDQEACRQELGFERDQRIILFVAHHVGNPRKGIDHIIRLMEDPAFSKYRFCSVGYETSELHQYEQLRQLGYILDKQKMAQIYNACDLFLLPSKAENFPNTICESLACGTPVVSFAVGGIPEIIHPKNGRLAEAENFYSLKDSVLEVFHSLSEFDRALISQEARQLFDHAENIQKLLNFYER